MSLYVPQHESTAPPILLPFVHGGLSRQNLMSRIRMHNLQVPQTTENSSSRLVCLKFKYLKNKSPHPLNNQRQLLLSRLFLNHFFIPVFLTAKAHLLSFRNTPVNFIPFISLLFLLAPFSCHRLCPTGQPGSGFKSICQCCNNLRAFTALEPCRPQTTFK